SSVTTYLSSFEQFGFLNEKLPLLNRSLAELVGIGSRFTSLVGQYQKQPVETLMQLQTALQQALGVPVTFTADGKALKIGFDFSAIVDEQLNINLDLGSLGIPNLDGLVDVRGEGKVRLAANANLHIDLGIDMSNPESPRPFLYSGTTTAGLGVKVWGKDLLFSASVLSFGVAIGNTTTKGYVAIDGDGVAEATYNPNDKVSYGVTLTDTRDGNADGRVYFSNLSAADLHEAPLTGQFHVNLPMFKKSDGSSIGAVDWNFSITNPTFPFGWDGVPGINASPDFSSLLTGLNLSQELDGFAGGLGDFFAILDTAIENQALLAKIPLIGDALRDAVRFVGDVRDKISDNLQIFGSNSTIIVQQKIYEALGPGGLNWLRDQNNSNWRTDPLNLAAISVDDVVIVENSSNDVRYSVRLKQSLARVSIPVDFDLGLPFLGLEVDGQVQLDIGFDWELGFGLDKNRGFYLTTGVSDEIRLALEASIPGLHATGKLGFLQLDVTDGTDLNDDGIIDVNEKTRVVGNLNIDLRDPGTGSHNDGKLTLSEMSGASFPQFIAASFPNTANTNRGDVRLHLVGSIAGNLNFPQIETDLTVGWAFGGSSPTVNASAFGSAPEIWFRNVEIDPGQAIQSFAKPVLEKINAILAPVKPVIEILQTPLPIISQLAGRDFTILDLAETMAEAFGGKKPSPGTRKFIQAAADLVKLTNFVDQVSASGNISLGSYRLDTFNSPGTSSNEGDLRSSDLSKIDPAKLVDSITNATPGSIPLGSKLSGAAKNFVEQGNRVPDANGSGKGFSFPILENPLAVLQILTGKNVDLFKYDMPQLKVVAPFQIPIPIIPPFLMGFFGGNIGAQVDFNFGFDTSGFRTGNPQDGFYVEDTIGGVKGARDPMEASLFGSVEVGATLGISLGPIELVAGAAGGLFAEVGLNLYDPNHDGKVYLPELIENISRGPEWLFDLQGEFGAYLRAFIKIKLDLGIFSITIVDAQMELFRITLLSFSAPPRGEISVDHLVNVNEQGNVILDNDGNMTLNLRADQDDNFKIREDASGAIVISARGQNRTYPRPSGKIKGNAGKGNDSIVFDESVTVGVDIAGGDGNDTLTYRGSGVAILRGEEGDDTLTGSNGADSLEGGAGRDKLAGNGGNDLLIGNSGYDEIKGGTGNDRIYGDEDDDNLYGELGNDVIYAGLGNDRVDGGLDNDEIHGEDGGDSLVGNDGSDRLYGGTGKDILDGGLGNDFLYGQEDDDSLDGGRNNDTLEGGTGNDHLQGNAGSDSLFGNDGNDILIAGISKVGGDTGAIHFLYGGDGDDEIYGDIGQDTIQGNSGNDRIDALAGNDDVRGGDGNDRIVAGLGSDLVVGGWGRDVIFGGIDSVGSTSASIESNVIYGDEDGQNRDAPGTMIGVAADHEDLIYGDQGDDFIYAGFGNDTIYALQGNDWIEGGWQSDSIFAGGDEDGYRYSGTSTSSHSVALGNKTFATENGLEFQVGDIVRASVVGDSTHWIEGQVSAYENGQLTISVSLIGNPGNSSASFANWNLSTTAAQNTIYGDTSIANLAQSPPALLEDHRDRIFGDTGIDLIFAGEGSDTVISLAGNDTVYGGGGDDLIDTSIGSNAVFIASFAGQDNDTAYGEAGEDTLLLGVASLTAGQSDKDLGFGGTGRDIMRGFADDDFLVGGTGDDDISGGVGSDVLWGGIEVISFAAFDRNVIGEFDYPTNFPGQEWPAIVSQIQTRIVPLALAGLSVEGDAADGSDTLRGDDGTDWLFGGGAGDNLFAGGGIDYVDGGAGNDRVEGEDGDDVLRGGTNDDILLGGNGIDQMFGDAGADRLFADGGTGTGITQVLGNQRLFGGDGIDYLYGYSFSTSYAAVNSSNHVGTESLMMGEEFHGGAGGDWIYGGIRQDVFYGDGGNDTIQGDALVGLNYADNSRRSLNAIDDTNPLIYVDTLAVSATAEQRQLSSQDVFYGGTGEDRLYGGGGSDEIWGGADSDWLEGQDSFDTLYGGAGIDMMLLDSSSSYAAIPNGQFEIFNGHFGNAIVGDSPDDNATDILLIEGTDASDTITVGQVDYNIPNSTRIGTRLTVGFNSRTIHAAWRDFSDVADANGKPLVEQIRISGLGGSDSIGFLSTTVGLTKPLDVSDLTERSDDWIGVIDGGPGNDTLSGSGARDRIDGGRDDDTIYGFAGDDQLWGDGGPGLGESSDNDVIYSGQGNDDVLGGQGTNALFSWSFNPLPSGDTQFGVFVGDDGQLYDNNGDLDANGVLDGSNPATPPRQLEDTGLNRVLGGPKNDLLFGGTGLDFMYGFGSDVPNKPDELFDRHGNTFDARGALAGDEWKSFAKNTDKVWYYGGTNRDDVIHVDYVTEPGVLQGHHLITRLTNNNGNFTFDAQVQLDFDNWSSEDSFYGLALTGTDVVPGTVPFADNEGRTNGVLSGHAVFSLSVDGGPIQSVTITAASTIDNDPPNTSLNPTKPIRNLVKDLNDALATAGLGASVSARASGDKISMIRRSSINAQEGSLVISYANAVTQNELHLDPDQIATVGYVGSNGLQSLLPPEGDFLAIIVDALDGNDQIIVGPTVIKSVWSDGGKGDDTITHVAGKPILPDKADTRSGGTVRNDSAANAYPLNAISTSKLYTGLSIDSPTDVDWFTFSLSGVSAGDALRVPSLSPNDRLSFELYDSPASTSTAVRSYLYSEDTAANADPRISLDGLPVGEYWLKVSTDRIPTVYELDFVVGTTLGTLASPVVIPTITDQASIVGVPLKIGNNFGSNSVYYQFVLANDARAGDQIGLNAFDASAPVTLTLLTKLTPIEEVYDAQTSMGVDSPATVSLEGLKVGTHYLKVTSSGTGRYELVPRIAKLVGDVLVYGSQTSINLSSQTEEFLGDPLLDPLGRYKYVRKDVLIGGDGNDILQGGSGEDWIFGGKGNDTLAGGFDRQAGDLLWGEEGDDIYQILTDRLPETKASQRRVLQENKETFIPTYTDRFDGGLGVDQVLYLGGDLDANGRVVPDNVAIRWNTILHRYELTSQVWNFQQQKWETEAIDAPAEIIGSKPGPTNGQLSGNLSFTLSGSATPVSVSKATAQFNSSFDHLVFQVNEAIRTAGLRGKVFASNRHGTLVLSTISRGTGASLALTAPNSVAVDDLALAAQSVTGQKDDFLPQQHYAFFTVFDIEDTTYAVMDTRRGDDEVHADPEYLIRGNEWGIDPEDRPQRAKVDLIIRGGDGNDRLFGGADSDRIEGGAGADVIRGGGGNDSIDGGSGDDWIAGGPSMIVPDRYEFKAGAANNNVAYAALLSEDFSVLRGRNANGVLKSEAERDVKISNLNLSYGDQGDWYVFKTPESLKTMGSAKAAQLVKDAIKIQFTDAEVNDVALPLGKRLYDFGYRDASGDPGRLLYLFAGNDTDPGEGLSVVPVERFEGVPEHYLIHVVNPNNYAIIGSAPVANPQFQHNVTTYNATFTLTLEYENALGSTVTDTANITVNGTTGTRSLDGLVTALNDAISATALSGKVMASKVSTQDLRVGFWATYANAKKFTLTFIGGGTNAAAADLFLTSNTVVNIAQLGASEAAGGYSLKLLASKLGGSTEVSATNDASAHVQTSNPGDRPAAIAVGDLNGDSYDDFVGSTFDSGSEHYARVFFGGPQEVPDPTSSDFASKVAHNNAVLNRHVLSLKLPAALSLTGAGTGTFSTVTSGDFNADGLSDLVVTVSAGTNAGVYTILGRPDAFALIGTRPLQDGDTLPIGATFSLRVDEGAWKQLTLTTATGETTVSLGTLLGKLNAAIEATGLKDAVVAEAVIADSVTSSITVHTTAAVGDRIRLRLLTGQSLQLSLNHSVTDKMKTVLGFRDDQRNAWPGGTIANQSLDIVSAHDVRANLATAIGGIVGNVIGAASTVAIPQPADIVTGLLGAAPSIYAGNANYKASATLWSADFADAQGNAYDEGVETSYTGLWNRTTRRALGGNHSGAAFYYGRNAEGNYDVGTNTGDLTTREIDLSGESTTLNDITLSFNYLLQTENATNTPASLYDRAEVIVQEKVGNSWIDVVVAKNTNGVSGIPLNDRGPNAVVADNANWDLGVVDLNSYKNKTIRLVFRFNSGDSLANNFEGWYVDNIAVKRIAKELLTSQQTLLDSATSLAGIGDYSGDGRPDFAVVSSSSIKIYAGGVTATAGPTITPSNNTFANYSVSSAGGNVFGNANEELLINSDSGPSFVIEGGTTGLTLDLTSGLTGPSNPMSVKRLATGQLIALGNISDISGDNSSLGMADLGTQGSETSDPVGELGSSLQHAIGRVYFGSTNFSPTGFANPDLVLETARPFYATNTAELLALGALGDIDNDNRADFGLGDSFAGRHTHVFLGRATDNNYVDTSPFTESAELFQVGMAPPLLPGHFAPGARLAIPQNGTVSVAQAAGLEGVATNEKLSQSRSIGDINGDSFEDFLLEGGQASYVVFGPVSFEGVNSVRDRADIILDFSLPSQYPGKLASKLGDIDGDGLTDLVFYKPTGSNLLVTTIFGAKVLPRNLLEITSYLSDSDRVRYGKVTLTGASDAIDVLALDWNGILDSSGRSQSELLVRRLNSAEVYVSTNFGKTDSSAIQIADRLAQFPTSTNGSDSTPNGTFGSVLTTYAIGTTEVTNQQYVAFLNSKAKSDSYSLFNALMTSDSQGGITRGGTSPNFTYAAKPGFELKPVVFVTISDAMRFANWIHNGQGTGDTETGAYTLNGVTEYVYAARNPNAQAWIPSSNEWYKAAFFDPAKSGGPGFWDYANRSDIAPTMSQANYGNANGGLTNVGQFSQTVSAYGTVDQMGNVWETTDTLTIGAFNLPFRDIWGGDFTTTVSQRFLQDASSDPSGGGRGIGFRIAAKPAALLNSTTTSIPFVLVPTASEPFTSVGDINGDGRDDLAAPVSGNLALSTSVQSIINSQTTFYAGRFNDAFSVSSKLYALSDLQNDGFDDFAGIWQQSNGNDSEVVLFYGSDSGAHIAGSVLRDGGSPGVTVRLFPNAGDFNGDGKLDLAILESVSATASSISISGRVYVFSNIASRIGSGNLTLANADMIIDSDTSTGIITTLASSPKLDLNADGLDDLIVGAADATGVLGSVLSKAGRVYTLEGARTLVQIPTDGINILTNRTITGSGDYLVDPATGRPAEFGGGPEFVLSATDNPQTTSVDESHERWFRFTTLGDGLPGESLQVGPQGDAPLTLYPQQAGTLQSTRSGVITIPVSNVDDRERGMILQPDGKIILSGFTGSGSTYKYVLTRHNSDGTLDASFGTGGIVVSSFTLGSGNTGRGPGVALQADGKIVIGGDAQIGSNLDFALIRYNSDGSLDSSFGIAGRVTTPIDTGDDSINAVAIQSDGRIVASGFATSGGNVSFAVARFNVDGSLDTSFNGTGKQTTSFGTAFDYGSALALQTDGRIIVVGQTGAAGAMNTALVRYTAAGLLDTSFGTDGKVITAVSSVDRDAAQTVAVQSDGRIVVGGLVAINNVNRFLVTRYNSNGSLDTSFNGTGNIVTPFGTTDDRVFSVAIQPDGKIVAAGMANNGVSDNIAVARYGSDGRLDTIFDGDGQNFDGDGQLITSLGTSQARGNSVAIQSDGKIIVAGEAAGISSDLNSHDFVLARYNSNGSLDNTFGTVLSAAVSVGGTSTAVGGSSQQQAVFEFDLSSLLPYQRDPNALIGSAQLNLDYNLTALSYPTSFDLSETARIGETMFFSANNGLWRTQGTVASTLEIKQPNGASFIKHQNGASFPDPFHPTVLGDTLYFSANGALWKVNVNSTVAATVKTGLQFSGNDEFKVVGGLLFFTAYELNSSAKRLWQVNVGGTDATKIRVPAVQGTFVESPYNLTAVSNNNVLMLYFGTLNPQRLERLVLGNDSTMGSVDATTREPSNITPVFSQANPESSTMYFVNGRCFTCGNNPFPQELRKIEGDLRTSSSTLVVTKNSPIDQLTNVNGTLFFRQGNQLWKSDGTANGTVSIDRVTFDSTQTLTLTAPDNLTNWNGRLYFSAQTAATGTELWTLNDALDQAVLVRDINSPRGAPSDPQKLTIVGDTLYFTADDGLHGRELWKTDGSLVGTVLVKDFATATGAVSNVTGLVAVGGKLFLTANAGDGATLWKLDPAATGAIPTMARVRDDLGAVLTVEVLDGEGDNRVTAADATRAALVSAVPVTIHTSEGQLSEADRGQLNAVITQGVQAALSRGVTRITVRLTMPDPHVRLDIQNSLAGGQLNALGVLDHGPGRTALVVTPLSSGVLVDVFDADGAPLGRDRSIVDLRHFDAGTYNVRVHRADPQSSPLDSLPFTLSITAPSAGQTRPIYFAPDRDVIHGGDGNDLIAGNEDLDRLFGDSGHDQFVADSFSITTVTPNVVINGSEIRDQGDQGQTVEAVIRSPVASETGPIQYAQLDPVVRLIDAGLRYVVAQTLDISTTRRYDGTPELATPIRASDLARLTTLDINTRGVTSLSGLEDAINLRALNLANNSIVSLTPIAVGRKTETIDEISNVGAPTGARWLKYLAADFNPLTDLIPLNLSSALTALSMDATTIESIAPLSQNKSLNLLSAHGIATEAIRNEEFTTDPNWSSQNTQSGGANIGFRTSNLTGNSIGGEAGGTFPRSGNFTYYADTHLGQPLDLNQSISASGEFDVTNILPGFNTGIFIGHFATQPGTTFPSIGWELLENNSTSVRVVAQIIFADGTMLRSLSGVSAHSITLNQDRTWSYRYDPEGGDGFGQITFTMSGTTDGFSETFKLTAAQRKVGLSVNAFGFSIDPLANPVTSTAELYIDHLNYTINPRLTDLSPVSGLTSLVTLDVGEQAISDLTPMATLASLQQLDLHNNRIRDISPLTGVRVADNTSGVLDYEYSTHAIYDEVGTGWLGDKNAAAFDGDYRVHAAGDGSATATWTFTNLVPGIYDVQATWPEHETRTSSATYGLSLNGTALSAVATQSVNQKLPPLNVASPAGWPQSATNPGYDQPWQSLRVLDITAGLNQTPGLLTITLSTHTNGTVAADTVRLVRVLGLSDSTPQTALPNLQRLSLNGNPLDNLAHEVFVPILETTADDGDPTSQDVKFDSNDAPLFVQTAGPQVLQPGSSIFLMVDPLDTTATVLAAVSTDTRITVTFPKGTGSIIPPASSGTNSLPSISLGSLNGSNGFTLFGVDSSDHSGWSVSNAGDVNGDGFDDLLIGAEYAKASGNLKPGAGESYLIFGKADWSATSTINLASLGSAGITIFGANANDHSGWSVSSAGDVNGDGFDDLLIGAEYAGKSYVIFGSASLPATINLATLGPAGITIFYASPFDQSGSSVSSAGDVNGDGYDDLLLGAKRVASSAGASFVIFGGASLPATIDLAVVGTAGITISGADAMDYSGRSVSSAGDVNGDGFDDVLIGSYHADALGNAKFNAGESYVIYGGKSPLPTIN
ncbi:MAG: SUMF1/EgtB/PvdO family nonheme iron enzyme, partial [Pirellula sp.]